MRGTGFFLSVCILFTAVPGCGPTVGKNANTTFTTVGTKIGSAKGASEAFANADGLEGRAIEKTADGAKTEEKKTAEDRSEHGPVATGPEMKMMEKKAGPTESPVVVAKDVAPAPAVAEAVVGREPVMPKAAKQQGPPSGILTAGSFDDNVDPLVFSSYLRRMSQRQGLGDLLTKLKGQRLLIIVKDGSGKPVGNARVRLSAGASAPVELVTRSDGRAVFQLSFDQIVTDQALLATVTGPDGGNPVTETIEAGASRWEVTLPGTQAQLPKNLDLAIILDTTGSMGDELEYLKSEIRGISAAIAKQFPEVKQRFALVLYRDEADEYVVRPFDFNESLDLFHKRLSQQSASGGGDYPEAMHKGLQEANQLHWKEDRDTARVAFLIADAPPHAQHMNATLAAVNGLRKKGVALYPVACSGYDDACEFVMRSSALLTGGQFLFLTNDSGVGNSHAEPTIPYYQVERLERLMIRMIASELSGQRMQANPADILRTVGKKVN